MEPLVEHEGDLNFNWLFFDDPPVWRDQIKEDGEVIMFREPSQKYGEKSTEERIEELEILPTQKLKLLDAYIKTLEELKTENKK